MSFYQLHAQIHQTDMVSLLLCILTQLSSELLFPYQLPLPLAHLPQALSVIAAAHAKLLISDEPLFQAPRLVGVRSATQGRTGVPEIGGGLGLAGTRTRPVF